MGWLAVDKNEREYIYDLYHERGKSKFDPEGYFYCIGLPKGTIEKLIGYKLTWEDEPVEYKETLYNLNMNVLTRMFPNFIFIDGCAEIIGYDPKNYIHMVIEDGNCCTHDNKWVVHQYKIKNPESFNWMEWKYICDNTIAEKILEQQIEFK